MTRKQILLIAAAIFACTNGAHAETTWYGLLTVDKFPLDNCVVTEFSPETGRSWFSGATAQKIEETVEKFESEYIETAKRDGFNAVLGYRTSFIGSGGMASYIGLVTGGVVSFYGVGVKVKCK